ncbi:hypothetical protein LEP1GSC050_0049 [Leptospira phage vB_LbrZ_5399-LE1]|uniref:Ubiquitin-like domain-containing protein n=1 Tax=Leptospira inadai serovar Lyme TaxID=293084 RepID=A0ABX4YGD3_9LEPT|nr:hypothetical protein [Leptospira inadai]AGS80687.1 hypothetical protein LEP1GSC050_0049 [Leptospira phage vB_LbrZ_5399-LE1]AGS80852.1 hypothetical protein LEP1GSC047_0920 [Leptospira phage vB_LinZ_10-LE1]PNV74313.1 hypothetical protein BES34_014095 [Leptospira inadai serovar Lyme]
MKLPFLNKVKKSVFLYLFDTSKKKDEPLETKLKCISSNIKLLEAFDRLRQKEWTYFSEGDLLRENQFFSNYGFGEKLLFFVSLAYPTPKILIGPNQIAKQVHGLLRCVHEGKFIEFEADFRSFQLVAKASDISHISSSLKKPIKSQVSKN